MPTKSWAREKINTVVMGRKTVIIWGMEIKIVMAQADSTSSPQVRGR